MLIIAALIVLVLSKISHTEPPLIFDKNCLLINLLYAQTEENTTSCRIIRIIRQYKSWKRGVRAKRHTWGRSQYAYHLQKISPFRLAVQRRDERCNTRIDPSGSRYQKNRLAITGKRSENHNDLANYLVAEEGSNLDDIYDLAVTTDGKIFFACRPDLPDDGKDVRNAI